MTRYDNFCCTIFDCKTGHLGVRDQTKTIAKTITLLSLTQFLCKAQII